MWAEKVQRLSKIICLAFSEGKKESQIHWENLSKLAHLSLAESSYVSSNQAEKLSLERFYLRQKIPPIIVPQ